MSRNGIALVLAGSLAACTATPETFYADKKSIDDLVLCRTLESADKGTNYSFRNDVLAELESRSLDRPKCQKKISEQMDVAVGVVVGAVLLGAAAAAAGGGAPAAPASSFGTDYDHDWDQFYNQYGQLTWRCRGVQTGQFANSYNCLGDAKVDSRWPGK